MEATLPFADSSERQAVVAEMLCFIESLDRDRSLQAALRLLQSWRNLDHSARIAVVDSFRPMLDVLIRSLIESDDSLNRRVGFEVSSACISWLTDPASPIGRLLREHRLLDVLDHALAEALARYPEHRVAGVLDAALAWSPSAPRRLRSVLGDMSQASNLVLRSAARARPDDAVSVRSLVAWLGVPALSAVARERVERLASRGEVVGLWKWGHLLAVRSRAISLLRLVKPERVVRPSDRPDWISTDGRAVASGWRRWVARLPLADHVRVEALKRAASDRDRAMRLAAARALGGMKPSPATDEALAALAQDSDEPTAWSAASALGWAVGVRRRRSLEPLWMRLCSSPHARLCLLARGESAKADPIESLRRGAWISPAEIRLRMAEAREEVLGSLKRAIEGEDSDLSAWAMEAAWRVGALDHLRASIIAAAKSGDPRRASKGVRLLGWIRGMRARSAAEEGLRHSDGRVRASAVEALARHRCVPGLIEPCTDDPTARVRANALVALGRGRVGEEEWLLDRLAAMLADHRPEHRLSGLWAAGRLGCSAVIDLCRTLAVTDPEGCVRIAAARCAGRLGARRGPANTEGWSAKGRLLCRC